MGCNCGKKQLTTQPKKIVKNQTKPTVVNKGTSRRRIIRRVAR